MKHMVIFSLLGPPLGWISVLVKESLMAGKWIGLWTLFDNVPLFLFLVYGLGLIPAGMTGVVDWYLDSRIPGWARVLATTFAGYVLASILGLWGYKPPYTPFTGVFSFGLIGIIPAFVCSLLAGLIKNGPAPTAGPGIT